MRLRAATLAAVAALAALTMGMGNASATGNTVTFSGQGLVADGFGGYNLATEVCGVANGAPVDGPYLLWVLTATGATSASTTGPWGTPIMTKAGAGTFKYVSGFYSPSTLPGNVSATYEGKVKKAQLVLGRGCRPLGAWCSPGFWINAHDEAWALTGYARTDLFNATVYPAFYDQSLGADPTLETVLGDIATYTSPDSGPYGLDPFNATAAFLTDNIPGFDFDPNALGLEIDTCPIDQYGNFKV